MEEQYHKSVLLKEVLELLEIKQSDIVVDATFGFGGHAREILAKLGKTGRLIAIEQDKEILSFASKNFFDDRIIFFNENFSALEKVLKNAKIAKVDKILFDLGVSSYHFDAMNRGFSFEDNSLDMRLDAESETTAEDLVNDLPEEELANLLYQNAEEYLSRRIARAIVDYRSKHRITSAKQLSEIINRAVRRRGRTNPATKTFQALRIAVNDELGVLQRTLPMAINNLAKGGRVAVISFHSLEDRIVKNIFKTQIAQIKILTKKPVVATLEEIKQNPRSRSAKLRVAERI